MTNVTRFAYDYAGRITDVYLPGTNQVVHVAWSATGQPTDLWDASGLVSLSYNQVFWGVTTNRFVYNAAGDLTGLIDGLNQQTAWSYDLDGRALQKTQNDNTLAWTNSYNANGWLTAHWTPARPNLTSYAYDAVGNLTNIAYSGGVSSNVSLAYDKNNRLVTMDDAAGHTAFACTPWGALASEDGPWAADTVSYSHNASGLRSALSLLEPNATAWGQTYTYDSAWRLATLASPAGEFGYHYLNASRLPTLLTLPNNGRITNSYDTLGRLLSTALLAANDTTLNLHGYLYDAADRRTNHTLTAGNQWSYGYDAISQLTSALGRESGGASRAHERFGYAYDAAGNLTNRATGSFWQRFWHGTNGLNQLSSVVRTTNASYTVAGMVRGSATGVTVKQNAETTPTDATLYADGTFVRTNVALADGTNTFTAVATDAFGRSATNVASAWLPETATFRYDLNGNLTGDGRRTFAYDDDDQLVSVTVTNGVDNWTQSTFTYDALGRRRVRTESVWRNNAWVAQSVTRYVYDDMLVLQERDGNNIPAATYTRGPDLSGRLQGAGGIGGLLALTRQLAIDPKHFYYHADAGGNVTALLDQRATVAARYAYDPCGNLLGLSGPMAEANLYRFSSKEFHANSGLYYYGYRFYEPSLQRWLNRDPLGEAGALGLYGFVGNDPVDSLDPLGYERYPWVVLPGQQPKLDPTPAQEPTLLEGFIPIVGPYRQAVYDAENGRLGWALFDSALAATDVVPLRSAIGGVCKGAWKPGSSAWKNARAWLGRKGYLAPWQEGHHWCVPRKGWGHIVPNWLKNQPWNIYGMPDSMFHNGIHGRGLFRWNLAERVWYGSPPWFRATLFSTAGREVNWYFNPNDSLAPVSAPPFSDF